LYFYPKHHFNMDQQTKKKWNAWAMYDWANSAYNLVITSTIFPAYYDSITTTDNGAGAVSHRISFFGGTIESASLYNYSLAFAYLVIAILSPILSSIADYRSNKKGFMKFFCYIGGLACCSMFFFTKDTLWLGIGGCIIAAIGYCGSLVFYNAFLPELAEVQDRDKLSARGFSFGYIGSVILQLVCLVFVFTIDKGVASRLSFLLVGLWWIAFAQIPFRVLKEAPARPQDKSHNILTSGFKELGNVWQQIKQLKVLKRYLFAFFFYSMGVQTVMLAATLFGSQVLRMSTQDLIVCILLIQLVAILGAIVMARLSNIFGNFQVLMFVVLIWIGICVSAYYTTTATQFYMLAVAVGLVMGGIQSLSRSTYSKVMPETKDTASFFSFYDVTEKVAIVIGMFSFGFIQEATGSMRNAIFALVFFFAIGLLGLLGVLLTQRKQKLIVN